MTDHTSQSYSITGIQVTDHFFDCPLDHLATDEGRPQTIKVFVRECCRTDASIKHIQQDRPLLLFLQGGPGFECSATVPTYSGMMRYLLDRYTVLLLDQRGTGLSTPLNPDTLVLLGDLEAQVKYCKFFRADSIVRDCELIRDKITKTRKDKKWVVLGQSFGGFCILTYLSLFPASLKYTILTGGVAPVCQTHPDAIYSAIIKKLIRQNEAYYRKFPLDTSRIRRIVEYLDSNDIKSPNGGNLSSRRFRQLGIELGMHNGFDRIHNVVIRAASDLIQLGILTYKTTELLEQASNFDGNPIYSLLHESIYCQNASMPSNWSSDRIFETCPEFQTKDPEQPIYLYGENIFSWMFEDYRELRKVKDLAHRIAQESWTPLYKLEVLKNNQIPIAASVYIEDMYVHVDFAIETLNVLGSAKDLITNRYLHNGLRHAPDELLAYLFRLVDELRAEKGLPFL